MKKAIAIIVAVLFVFSFAGLSFATEKAAEKAAPAKAEETKAAEKPKVKMVTGEVKAVDAKAKTLTVKGKKADVTVTCDDKTKIMMGKEKKTLADVMTGDKVTVKYTEAEGKNVAKSISIKAAETAPAEKKTEPAKTK
ncbi:MAG: DUF5666 domain-containing protein [Nitrospirota bacterium]